MNICRNDTRLLRCLVQQSKWRHLPMVSWLCIAHVESSTYVSSKCVAGGSWSRRAKNTTTCFKKFLKRTLLPRKSLNESRLWSLKNVQFDVVPLKCSETDAYLFSRVSIFITESRTVSVPVIHVYYNVRSIYERPGSRAPVTHPSKPPRYPSRYRRPWNSPKYHPFLTSNVAIKITMK